MVCFLRRDQLFIQTPNPTPTEGQGKLRHPVEEVELILNIILGGVGPHLIGFGFRIQSHKMSRTLLYIEKK